MVRAQKIILLLLVTVFLLTGCAMATVEKLYCLPKRSEEYENVQAVIEKAMQGLSYSAPVYGENRQFLQAADLDGDGIDEYLVFAKDDSDKPLKILIFAQLASGCVLMDTIEGYGFGFDFVSYAQLDDRPGVELIVGRHVSDQVTRNVAVYRFTSGIARQLLSIGYNEIATTDLDQDGISELLLLTAGATEKSAACARLYSYRDGELQRSAELLLSAPITDFRQLNVSALPDGTPAVYVTCAAEAQKLVTDILIMDHDELSALVKGITVSTMGNYYIYPEDMDSDGVVELPRLVPLTSPEGSGSQQFAIEWYSLGIDQSETVKTVTYHNYSQNWYLELSQIVLSELSVQQTEAGCVFYYGGDKVLTLAALTDADREEQSQLPGNIILYASETVIYTAILEDATKEAELAEELLARFHTIRVDLNTEED